MKSVKSQETVAVLANANELVANILKGVVGNELADSINGAPANKEVIYSLVQSEVRNGLSIHLEGK